MGAPEPPSVERRCASSICEAVVHMPGLLTWLQAQTVQLSHLPEQVFDRCPCHARSRKQRSCRHACFAALPCVDGTGAERAPAELPSHLARKYLHRGVEPA